MGKHIPGSPTILVENMPGAGSLVSANHLYKVAKPDGLTIGNFGGGLFLQQVLGRSGVEFDARKFEYIGVPAKLDTVCAFTKASGITSLEKWMASKSPVKVAGEAPGSITDDVTKILKGPWVFPSILSQVTKGAPPFGWLPKGGRSLEFVALAGSPSRSLGARHLKGVMSWLCCKRGPKPTGISQMFR